MKDACVVTFADREPYLKNFGRMFLAFQSLDWEGCIYSPPAPPHGCPPPKGDGEVRCAFKLFLMQEIISEERYPVVIWMDSSLWPIRPMQPLVDAIRRDGYHFRSNGIVGTWCADRALEPLEITREQSFEIEQVTGGFIGLDMSQPIARDFMREWWRLLYRGAFVGPRWEERIFPDLPQRGHCSDDPRVRGHRADQTAASVAAWRLGMKVTPNDESPIFLGRPHESKPHTIICMAGGVQDGDLEGIPYAPA